MEIKPQHLRIGIQLKIAGDIQTVTSIEVLDGHKTLVNSFVLDACSGIELTPEWLERFGFNKRDDNYFDGVSFTEYRIGMFTIGRFNDQGYLLDAFDSMPPMRYVHQLQNLFYALTGEELAIDKTSLKN